MTPEKQKELETKLKRIFEQSFKDDLETVFESEHSTSCAPRSVIRRRKGVPDKRIEIKSSGNQSS